MINYVRENYKKMTRKQMAKNLNVTDSRINAIMRTLGFAKKDSDNPEKISSLLKRTKKEIKQTLQDIFPHQYIKIKIKKKVTTPDKIKIKLAKYLDYYNFKIYWRKKIVAEGEYHRPDIWDSIKNIKKIYITAIK